MLRDLLVRTGLLRDGVEAARRFEVLFTDVVGQGTRPEAPAARELAECLLAEGLTLPEAMHLDADGQWARNMVWDHRAPLLEGLRLRMRRFCREHLPAGASSPHQVLYDFEGRFPDPPSRERAAACLRDYLGLVEEAHRLGPEEVRGVLDASELALGLLARFAGVGEELADVPELPRLQERLGAVLAEAGRIHPAPLRLDGYKRLGALLEVLDRLG
jgi:hypothetical protein